MGISHGPCDVRVAGAIFCHVAGARAGNVIGEGKLGSAGVCIVGLATPDAPNSPLLLFRPARFLEGPADVEARYSLGYSKGCPREEIDITSTSFVGSKIEVRFHYY